MADIINLRRARKARDRQAAESAASEARARHGRTRGERNLQRRETERASGAIEGHRLTDGNADPEQE